MRSAYCRSVFGAARALSGHATADVLCGSHWLKMIRVDAAANTTLMIKDKARRNRPVALLVSCAVRPLLSAAHFYSTISTRQASEPQTTSTIEIWFGLALKHLS